MAKSLTTSGPLNLQGTFTVQAEAPAQDGQKPPNPKFALAAYNGAPMTVAGWKYPVVVDGQGVRCADASGRIPVYASHVESTGNLLGQSSSVTIVQGGRIQCDGEITGMGADASDSVKQVMLHAKNGFQWQCSIGASVDKAEFIAESKTAVINGAEVTGPVYVARSTVLGHVAIVPLGADTTTSAKIAAQAAGEITMNEFEKWIAATFNMEASALTPEQKTKFEAQFAAHEKAVADAKALEAAKPPADPTEGIRLETAREMRRIEAVRKVCGDKHPAIAAQAVEERWTPDRTELEVLRAGFKPTGTAPAIHAGGVPLTQRVIEAAGCIGGGIKADSLVRDKNYGEQVVEAAMKISRHGLGPKAILRLAAQMEGIQLPVSDTGNDFIRAAFSTMSLPTILSNLMNKLLLEGYQYVEQSWTRIAKRGPVNDFKPHYRVRLTEDFKFVPLGPDGEIKHGSVGEQKYTITADTQAIMFSLTRKSIINDDQSAFADLPRRFSTGAGEAINELVWTTWLANLMSDGTTPFFSDGNANLTSGATTGLSFESLTAAYAKFLAQTKPNGKPLGMEPKILLVPSCLKTLAMQLIQSQYLIPALVSTSGAAKGLPQNNIFNGMFDVVSSAYLSNATLAGHSSTAWYLLADPVLLHSIEAAFLNGQEMPTVERAEADFDTLGIQFRSWLDFGIAMGEPRAAQMITGVS